MLNKKNNKENSSLVVVGTGIKFMSHLTTEAKAHITKSDKVLYLINNPIMKAWIQNNNHNSESLDRFYEDNQLRRICYENITKYIFNDLLEDQHICVALEGHPSVFATPALNAVILAKQHGYYAKILPGISSEDCLFADLLIDPGSSGCQSFEATDFLIHKRIFDPTCHLILWQVDEIGILKSQRSTNLATEKTFNYLQTYLMKYYEPNHEVILYEAAEYPHLEPKIEKYMLSQLTKIDYSPISTLYIPPTRKSECDQEALFALNINYSDLI